MLKLSPVERVGASAQRSLLDRSRTLRKPLVIEDFTASWPARERWSLDYLKSVAGDRLVPVYDSRPARGRQHQHAAAARMPFGTYLERLRGGEKDLRIFFVRLSSEMPELLADFNYPDIGVRYFEKLSVLFAGGRGARVQMHFDIEHNESFLSHFGGRKRVILFAPDQTPYLYHVPFSVSSRFDLAPDKPDYERFPALALARGELAELAHGDTLYLPPRYWHYVLYDDIGFSLSLRTLPSTARDLAAALYNIAVLRTVDGWMRRCLGQRWNDRNERVAVERVHRRLALSGRRESQRWLPQSGGPPSGVHRRRSVF
jgi:hypothetical protein